MCPFCERVSQHHYDTLDGDIASFTPLDPITEGHRLFIPTLHVRDAASSPKITAQTIAIAARWALAQGGDFNLITSRGESATQTVFHLHVHYIPRRKGDNLVLPWSKYPD